MTLPLDGITVVALEQAVAAPFATRQLADLGARVIKVERVDGGDFARGYDDSVKGLSSYFVWLNRGKQSVTLDIKDAADRAVLDAMVAAADVFVANLGPGALQRLGLDAEPLRAAHPRLVTCTISGYGPEGPYSTKRAYDLLVQCETGLLSVTGTPEAPAKVGISVADIAAGMYAYSGVLAALYERERTGVGSAIEVAMIDALAEWVTQPYLYTTYGGEPPPRAGARHASISPYGPYAAVTGARCSSACRTSGSGCACAPTCWGARSWPVTRASRATPSGCATTPSSRRSSRRRSPPAPPRTCRPVSTRQTSPMLGFGPWPSSPTTLSCWPGTGGGWWRPRPGRCAPRCHRWWSSGRKR